MIKLACFGASTTLQKIRRDSHESLIGLTYGYNYGESIELSKPDYVFDHFNDLLPVLGLSNKEHQE